MQDSWLTLLPPLVSITLALITRQVIVPLLLGVATGAVLLTLPQPAASWWWMMPTRFIGSIAGSVSDPDHLMVLAFTCLLGAMVGVLERTGHLAATILAWSKRIRTRRGGQSLIASTGLLIFFDDYANTLLVGGTMRSAATKYGISRAKLAYLVDSTAAPVAGLALVSTWVATEISYLQQGLADAGWEESSVGFSVFLSSLAYRFYPVYAILLVFLIAWTGREFGPMKQEEILARRELEEATRQGLKLSVAGGGPESGDSDPSNVPMRWWANAAAAFLPIVICLTVIVGVLLQTGLASMNTDSVEVPRLGTLQYVGQVLGNGDSYQALVAGGAAGWLAAFLVGLVTKCPLRPILLGTVVGVWQMMPAMLVLWLAWSLSGMTSPSALNTGGYLASLLTDRITVEWLPTCVFLLASVVAFATGTSWGTMALMTPLAVSLSLTMAQAAEGQNDAFSPWVLATFSSVLAGAIFGDHCSPLSDTTVLSSRACECEVMTHVRTQLPYAITAGSVSVFVCVATTVGGLPLWLGWSLGTILLVGIVLGLGIPILSDE